ncbi:hypothetical protein M430DRAFT_136392 [Amorphotheca resinae ATCC 22711]|uniref:NAD(P)-binding domain-containing protein n=1 Tax=Amorphotheca resinae ATCC 22711 TaxID=857342 RepID=A0A2T3B993_AMORE|nr:hypothetical protein M430DRAFT_136392 [Amorphotheca resinae ATCC 22711]PSS23445.1 hypothetical protein M430DRAFT_136392 [Amorphotheca resinae ATCC 22711]
MTSRILVLGATGQTGIDFSNAALEAGHQLTLYVRNPSKVPENIKSHEKVSIVEGQLSDEEKLKQAVASGATVFVSFAGPTFGSTGTPVSDSLKLLLPLLISHNYQRAIITATCSYTAPEDQGGLKWRAVVGLIRLIGGSAYHEIQGIGAQVTSQDPAKLKWTLIRLPFLDNGDAKHVTATFTGSGKDGLFLSRKSAAAWVLDQLDSEEWVGKCPALCN